MLIPFSKEFLLAVCFALGIALAVVSVSPLQQSPIDDYGQPPHSKQYGAPEQHVGNAVPPAGAEALAEPKRAEHPKAGKEHGKWYSTFIDHPAEWVIAVFTIMLAAYTRALYKATAGLQTATLGLVNFAAEQARDMKASIAVAETSAKQAKRAADVAEQALISGDRAFVFVSFSQSPITDVQTGKIFHWNFTPIWNNTGNTPTRNMFNHISIRLTDAELPDDWDFPDTWPSSMAPAERIRTPMALAPKSTANGQTVGISLDDCDEVASGRKLLYIWGWASYNDVFPNTAKHVTRFAVMVVVSGNVRKADRVTFTYRFLYKYNCADEECDRQGYPASLERRQTTIA